MKKRCLLAVLLMTLAVAACGPATAGEGEDLQATPSLEAAPGGGRGPVAPNESLVTGRVLDLSAVSAEEEGIQPEQTLYKLRLEILASEEVGGLPSLVRAGDTITVYSKEALSRSLVGETIRGQVELAGDEWGRRYWIRDIFRP